MESRFLATLYWVRECCLCVNENKSLRRIEQSSYWNRRDIVTRYKAAPKRKTPVCLVWIDRVGFILIEVSYK